MTYSVWDHAARQYDYYQSPERSQATSAPKPDHLRGKALGLAPEDAAWPLPAGSRKVGTGKHPVGFIASRESQGLGILDVDFTPTNLLLLGAVGYFVWRHFHGS